MISSQLRYDDDINARETTLKYYYDGQNAIAEYDESDNLWQASLLVAAVHPRYQPHRRAGRGAGIRPNRSLEIGSRGTLPPKLGFGLAFWRVVSAILSAPSAAVNEDFPSMCRCSLWAGR